MTTHLRDALAEAEALYDEYARLMELAQYEALGVPKLPEQSDVRTSELAGAIGSASCLHGISSITSSQR